MENHTILQPPHSQLCSVYALKKALEDQKINLEVLEIQKHLDISDDYGIGLYDLALYPLQLGLQIKAFAFDTSYMPHQWLNQSSDYLKKYLKDQPKLLAWQKSMLNGLEGGIEYSIQIMSLERIQKLLEEKFSIVLYLNSTVLYQNTEGKNGHYVNILEIKDEEVVVQDSHWEFGGIKKYPKIVVEFAFYSMGGHALAIHKSDL